MAVTCSKTSIDEIEEHDSPCSIALLSEHFRYVVEGELWPGQYVMLRDANGDEHWREERPREAASPVTLTCFLESFRGDLALTGGSLI